jgi:phosphomannomutase
MKKQILAEEFKRMKKLAGIITEGYMGQFYAPEYLEQKYGKAIAKKIEDAIEEMDSNSWDRFTGMESAKEVEDYIKDIKNMLESAGVLKENTTGLTYNEIEEILNDVLEQYLEGIGENTDENGNIDFGNGVGYKTKAELLEDFAVWVSEFE